MSSMSREHSSDYITLETTDRFSGTTAVSSRFRESTNVIPTPESQGKRPKPYTPLILRLPVLISTPLTMLLLGIGLEVAIFISNHDNGFTVPVNNVFNIFGDVSAQFLASFFPTLLVLPLAFTWRELDWNVRSYQPYLTLQKGNALAEESLLLDYVELGPLPSLFRALHYKHRTVFWSAATALLTYTFQPLTGSIFQIRQADQTDTTTVTSIKNIGLATDGITDLNSFAAAAGYTDASAVLDNIGDPEFVWNGWATAEVAFPANRFLNGTMTVQTSGIQTQANCSNPVSSSSSAVGTNINITSTSVNGCTAVASFDTSVSTSQYGVVDVSCSTTPADQDIEFHPVAFWFYNRDSSTNAEQNQTVFCAPIIQAFEVQAIASLNNGSLTKVTGIGPFNQDNDVFSSPQNGTAFNGVLFTPNPNPFIQARADAIKSIVPAAIFKAAARSPGGLQATFNLPNGFLDFIDVFYLRHLSVSALAVYFVDQNTTLTASVDSLVPRLVIDALPAHLLAIMLILTGLIGLPLMVRHRGQRQRLLLATPPGSIGSIVALTGRSGFGELLLPYDDALTLERKLDGLRFRLDARTGAIVADDTLAGERGDTAGAISALMGGADEPPDTGFTESSTFLAQQAAKGQLPWGRSWAPASEPPPKSPLSHTEYVP